MINELDFKKKLKNLNRDQLETLTYTLAVQKDTVQENYDSLKRRLFGIRHNEKNAHVSVNQLSLFNEMEETVDHPEDNKDSDHDSHKDEKKKKSSKKKGGKNSKIRHNTVTRREDIWPDDKKCPKCGKPMEELKSTTVSYLEHIPEKWIMHEYVIHNFTCHECNDKDMECKIVSGDTSKLEKRLIPGSDVTESVVSYLAYEKLFMGSPFYRISKNLELKGVYIGRQNMCNWLYWCGEHYLDPVVRQMQDDLRKCGVLNMDETTLEVLEDVKDEEHPRDKSYTWLAMSGIHEPKQMALYFYYGGREYECVNKILGDSYHGVIQSDGYQAYDNYEAASGHAGCSGHARRKFNEAAQSYTRLYKEYYRLRHNREKQNELLDANPSFKDIIKVLDLFSDLYRIEKKLREKKAGAEEILDVRQKDEVPIWEDLKKQVQYLKDHYVMSGKLNVAVTYFENQLPNLMYYLKDWRVDLDNNLAEREGIKPFVMARKNFLFSDTRSGARYTCMYFSLLISARMNHLNPELYLSWMLKQLKDGYRNDGTIPDEVIQRVLPYAEDLPDNIKISKNRSDS